MTLVTGTVLAASLLAAANDLRSRRIPNMLVAALLVCGLIENVFLGPRALLIDVALTAAVFVAGSFAFSAKLAGGGDVKFIAVAAGALGYPSGVLFILFTLLSGGVFAFIYAAVRGRLGATLSNVQAIALPMFAGMRPARPASGTAMPYALAIFGGALCVALLTAFAPTVRILP